MSGGGGPPANIAALAAIVGIRGITLQMSGAPAGFGERSWGMDIGDINRVSETDKKHVSDADVTVT